MSMRHPLLVQVVLGACCSFMSMELWSHRRGDAQLDDQSLYQAHVPRKHSYLQTFTSPTSNTDVIAEMRAQMNARAEAIKAQRAAMNARSEVLKTQSETIKHQQEENARLRTQVTGLQHQGGRKTPHRQVRDTQEVARAEAENPRDLSELPGAGEDYDKWSTREDLDELPNPENSDLYNE